MVEAVDAVVKAAKVDLVGFEKIVVGYVTAIVRGMSRPAARQWTRARGRWKRSARWSVPT